MNVLRSLGRVLLFVGGSAFACAATAGSCTVTSVTLSPPPYTSATGDSATGSVSWTCTRTSNSADGSSITFNTSATGSGSVSNGGGTMAYSLTGTSRTLTATYATGVNTYSSSYSFTFSIAAGLNPSAGTTYTDTVTFGGTCTAAKKTGTCSVTPATLSISVDVTPKCAVSTPADLNFVYTSFQTTKATAYSQYTVNCTKNTPYTMSLSPASGTLLNVPYALTLGTTANSATDITGVSNTGTGTSAGSGYFVNGAILPGFVGTCTPGNCTASATHTLIVSY